MINSASFTLKIGLVRQWLCGLPHSYWLMIPVPCRKISKSSHRLLLLSPCSVAHLVLSILLSKFTRIHSFSPILEKYSFSYNLSAFSTKHPFSIVYQLPHPALVMLPQVFAHSFPLLGILSRCILGHSLNMPSSTKPSVIHSQEWPQLLPVLQQYPVPIHII